MNDDDMRCRPHPGKPEQGEPLRAEISRCALVYQNEEARQTLMQPAPPAWIEVENRSTALIRDLTGNDELGHVVQRLRGRSKPRMLSLGCGPGGVELVIAQHAGDAELVCLDIDAGLLQLGRRRAAELALNVEFVAVDLNTAELPVGAFDVVFCHAALYLVLELERLVDQIKRSLRQGGVFIAVDLITRNRYLMWPETRAVVDAIWQTLPARFRLNHTAYGAPLIDDEIWEPDTGSGRECVRSEDILPTIGQRFVAEHFVPYLSISRRFFDAMYGPNYDLAAPLDRALFDWIWQLDRYYLDRKELRPETFFGIYRPA